MGSQGSKAVSCRLQRLWLDWADDQADLRVHWMHRSFYWFCHAPAQLPHEVNNEPQHDKTNKVSVRPAKTQISLGICPVWSESRCPVWSESSLSAWRNLGPLATHWMHSEDSDQTEQMPSWSESSLGAHSFCWFCHVAARILQTFYFLF